MNKVLSAHVIKQLAIRQLADYRATNPGTCFSDHNFNISVSSAYALQDTITKIRIESGERVIGYKVGCTGPGTRTQFGMDGPIRGTLFAGEAQLNKASINPNEFCQLAIEGEMAISVGENYEIEAAFPVIELHNFIFRSDKKTLSELIANNGINAGIVLPETIWQESTKYIRDGGVLTLSINGSDIGNAGLWPNDGGSEESLIWLKNNLIEYGIELVPGDIVLAGTALGLYPVKDGDEIVVYIDGESAVSCSIKTPHTTSI